MFEVFSQKLPLQRSQARDHIRFGEVIIPTSLAMVQWFTHITMVSKGTWDHLKLNLQLTMLRRFHGDWDLLLFACVYIRSVTIPLGRLVVVGNLSDHNSRAITQGDDRGKILLYLEHTLTRLTWNFLEGDIRSRWHKWSYLH